MSETREPLTDPRNVQLRGPQAAPATIVAAVDNSPAAMQAVRFLAGYKGDRRRLAIVVLNVQTRPFSLWPGPAIDPGAVETALIREGSAQLEPARTLLAASGFEPETAVRLSFPPEACVVLPQ